MLGEQTFDALGKRWMLFLGNAAQCAVEQDYGKGFFAVVADAVPDVDGATAVALATAMSAGEPDKLDPALLVKMADAMRRVRLTVLRDLAWHGLRRHHPEVTLDDVSDMTDELGQQRFGEIIGAAIRAAQGKASETGEAGGEAAKGNRQTRRSQRTGPRSSSNGAGPGTTNTPSG
jgi:hypothetical protein